MPIDNQGGIIGIIGLFWLRDATIICLLDTYSRRISREFLRSDEVITLNQEQLF
jgi:hypothetical protein